MDTSEIYIKMSDCPEIQEKPNYDRCSFWAKRLITGKYVVWMDLHNPDDIFLPRQDQVQRMMAKDSINIELNKFYVFCLEKDYIGSSLPTAEFDSFEQLWLAFYMYEKHKKFWNGEEWVTK